MGKEALKMASSSGLQPPANQGSKTHDETGLKRAALARSGSDLKQLAGSQLVALARTDFLLSQDMRKLNGKP